ncbi:hypothetical protein ACFVW1_13950 [Streptomyces olivochromogenes]|uniref:hypothetical protein n=1 Tax=Streptomyces olivochromogenes TaxID=1963 RepID=UPI0036DB81B7
MIVVEDWAEIRRLHRAGQVPHRAIARHLGISTNTVNRALANDRPPQYRQPAKGSAVDTVEELSRPWSTLRAASPPSWADATARPGWIRPALLARSRVAVGAQAVGPAITEHRAEVPVEALTPSTQAAGLVLRYDMQRGACSRAPRNGRPVQSRRTPGASLSKRAGV